MKNVKDFLLWFIDKFQCPLGIITFVYFIFIAPFDMEAHKANTAYFDCFMAALCLVLAFADYS